jgi:hypothetical protein
VEPLVGAGGAAHGGEAGLGPQERGEPDANGRLRVDDGDADHAGNLSSPT